MSVRAKQVRTLIANGEARMRAQLHRLYTDRSGLEVIADTASTPQAIEGTQDWPPQIIGEKSGRIYFLDIHNVAYLASAGNYVAAHLGGDEFLTRATLKSMSVVLSPLGFIQIQRSLLVNLRQVVHVERCDRGQFCFVMRNGDRLVSSRERSGSIRALLLGATLPHRL